MEDTQIVTLYLQRKEEAIAETSQKYGKRLQRLAYGVVAELHTAEECENDTYLEAWRSIPPHEPREYLFAFLARITRHLALDCCRSRNRLKRSAFIGELSEEMEQCIPAPDDMECRLDALALQETLNGFLGKLSEEKKESVSSALLVSRLR